jgi:hypothetical protein
MRQRSISGGGITPELSRDAQRPSGVLHDSATSEAAKRSRLERLVRRLFRKRLSHLLDCAEVAHAKRVPDRHLPAPVEVLESSSH